MLRLGRSTRVSVTDTGDINGVYMSGIPCAEHERGMLPLVKEQMGFTKTVQFPGEPSHFYQDEGTILYQYVQRNKIDTNAWFGRRMARFVMPVAHGNGLEGAHDLHVLTLGRFASYRISQQKDAIFRQHMTQEWVGRLGCKFKNLTPLGIEESVVSAVLHSDQHFATFWDDHSVLFVGQTTAAIEVMGWVEHTLNSGRGGIFFGEGIGGPFLEIVNYSQRLPCADEIIDTWRPAYEHRDAGEVKTYPESAYPEAQEYVPHLYLTPWTPI